MCEHPTWRERPSFSGISCPPPSLFPLPSIRASLLARRKEKVEEEAGGGRWRRGGGGRGRYLERVRSKVSPRLCNNRLVPVLDDVVWDRFPPRHSGIALRKEKGAALETLM